MASEHDGNHCALGITITRCDPHMMEKMAQCIGLRSAQGRDPAYPHTHPLHPPPYPYHPQCIGLHLPAEIELEGEIFTTLLHLWQVGLKTIRLFPDSRLKQKLTKKSDCTHATHTCDTHMRHTHATHTHTRVGAGKRQTAMVEQLLEVVVAPATGILRCTA